MMVARTCLLKASCDAGRGFWCGSAEQVGPARGLLHATQKLPKAGQVVDPLQGRLGSLARRAEVLTTHLDDALANALQLSLLQALLEPLLQALPDNRPIRDGLFRPHLLPHETGR